MTFGADRRAHWLPQNEANRFPRRIVTLDSESRATSTKTRERHRFRCAVACADVIDRETRLPSKTAWCEASTPLELWSFIDGWTRANARTVVFAHNLAFDLRLTDALRLLPELGWDLQAFSLDQYRCWARWKRGTRGLSMVDTTSFYPASLDVLAGKIGMRKRSLPDQAAGDDAWMQRCRRDVEITREVALQLLGWLEGNDMGSFRLTGPAQAEAAFRHRFLPAAKVLVHDHGPAIDAERRSCYTGRCEVWQHGRRPGYLYEWDYQLAYAQIARYLAVPTRFVGHLYGADEAKIAKLTEHYAVLADVDVQVDVPVVPTRQADGILWPVGRFSSTLWDRELQLIEAVDGSYQARQVWLYERAPVLAEWAEWIIAQLDQETSELDPLQRVMVKAWSRSMIGRFGLRYPLMEHVADSPASQLDYRPIHDADSGELKYELRIGTQIFEQAGSEEGRNSIPAIMAYVMAESRRVLWGTMMAADLRNVAYIDTDSILVDAAGHERLQQLFPIGGGGTMRYKRRMRAVELYAPRVVVAGQETKIAGLSKRSTRTGKRTWSASYWESTKSSLARGRPDEVVVELRHYTIRPHDRRRRHLPGGRTAPYHLDTWQPSE